jgi:heme-degrading monooxygenase HmoA
MFLRIIFFSATTPRALEEGKRMWNSELAPLLKQQKGFCKAYRAAAYDEPGGVMVQLWESKADEEAWRSLPEYQRIVGKLETLLPELRIERDFVVDKEL